MNPDKKALVILLAGLTLGGLAGMLFLEAIYRSKDGSHDRPA